MSFKKFILVLGSSVATAFIKDQMKKAGRPYKRKQKKVKPAALPGEIEIKPGLYLLPPAKGGL